MLCALALPVWADTTEDLSTHTFKVYQIFKGDVHNDATKGNILSNVQWGESVNNTAPSLADIPTLSDKTDAKEVLDIVSKYTSSGDDAIAFARQIYKDLHPKKFYP